MSRILRFVKKVWTKCRHIGRQVTKQKAGQTALTKLE